MVSTLLPRRQHEHSRRLWILLRGGEHGESVGHREQQVEHDEIPAVRREQLDRLSSVARDDRVEPLGLQSVGEEPRDQGLVFDDQDVHLRDDHLTRLRTCQAHYMTA